MKLTDFIAYIRDNAPIHIQDGEDVDDEGSSKGETDYKSLIPCNYKPLPKDDGEGQKEAA